MDMLHRTYVMNKGNGLKSRGSSDVRYAKNTQSSTQSDMLQKVKLGEKDLSGF